MEDEDNLPSSSQGESESVENLLCMQWNPVELDGTPFIGNEERIIRSVNDVDSKLIDKIKNSSFRRLDFLDVNFRDFPLSFWKTCGERIKSLTFDHCILDQISVEQVVEHCTHLEEFGLHASDLFFENENTEFATIFRNLVELKKKEMSSVKTLVIKIEILGSCRCNLDQTIFNIMQMFPNFKHLTLIHDCDLHNFPNFSSLKPPYKNSADRPNILPWQNIINLLTRKFFNLETLNIEFYSSLLSTHIWNLLMDSNRHKLKCLRELTFEIVPNKSFLLRSKSWVIFLKHLRKLETITCKLLQPGHSMDSQLLNKFLSEIVKNCSSLQHFKIEYLQVDVGRKHNEWNINFDLLRDILASNLVSLRIHVNCCDIFLDADRNDFIPWYCETLEFLSLSFLCKRVDGRQYQSLAGFISQMQYLKHLHLGGDLNDTVLRSIWKHQQQLKGLALYFFNSSTVTKRGFFENSSKTEVTDISNLKNLEYLKIDVQKEIDNSEKELELSPVMFTNFDKLVNLRYLSIRTNTTDTEFVIRLCEKLKQCAELRGLYVESKVKDILVDFWYHACRYCPNLEKLYIKNNRINSKSFSVFQYKDFFRYCTSLKLLIHENKKRTHRWYKSDGKSRAERITNDNQICLIAVNKSKNCPEFWYSPQQ